MSWRTLELVLMRMGFPPRFCSWVLSCIRAPRFAILVNGPLTDVITARCGFHQGCPLSSYLFILCSELLSLHFHQNFQELGVHISVGEPPTSHLLYADDVLIFAGASISNVKKIMTILEDYCLWTGQKVNRNKSAILFSRMTSSPIKNRLARHAGCCKVEEMEYLGIKFSLRRCMRHRYGDWPWMQEHKRGDSIAWKVICNGANSLVKMFAGRCNGIDIDALNHVWIYDMAIASWPTFCNIESIEGCMVEEFNTIER
ncbi:hypothetical protein KFK09_011558 [Dendrobium nobile]|uniref:Reverse transcriptase domain-containing protein n=1 Tax=Dendrobium nobile TaxID=94219 RepID=A0A8T3BFD5_DENNO|nr:hypothetical protein KFK09_011558 [Dendrobium nobile]